MIRLVRNPMFALATLAFCGSLALSQQAPTQPAAPSQPAAAPVERQPPAGQMRPGMGQGMRRGPMGPGMMQDRHGFRGTEMHGRGNFRGGQGGFHGERRGGMETGFHIAPPGMWWKNPMIVQRLTLTPEQTKKMDSIFEESRIQLIDLKANVEKAEVMLEPLLSANPLDSARAMAQIDKVAQARADLEKADAKMLLGIRAVLTPDQWTKLNDHRGPGAMGQQPGGPGSPSAQAGPGGGRGHWQHGSPASAPNNLTDPIDQF